MSGYIILFIVLVLLYILGVRSGIQVTKGLDKKQHPLYFLYGAVEFWLCKGKYFKREAVRKKIEIYQILHPSGDAKKIYSTELYRRISSIYMILCLVTLVCIVLQARNKVVRLDEFELKRPSVGKEASLETLDVILRENEKETEAEIKMTIEPRRYTKEELDKLQSEAEKYIREHVRGDNESLDKVFKPLNLMNAIPKNPYRVFWTIPEPEYIGENGMVFNKGLTNEVITTITADVSYKQYETCVEIPLTIQPYKWTWAKKTEEDYKFMLQELDKKNVEQESYQLPSKVGNVEVTYQIKQEDKAFKVVVLTILGCMAMWGYWTGQTKKRKKNRDDQCLLEYPSLVYKLTLLLGAGMTLHGAWKRIVNDYIKERDKQNKYLYVYEEMVLTWHEIENGVSEMEAFTQFGKRMKLRPYLRFSSLITQNLKKGTRGFLGQLEEEAREAQEERKQRARRLGEEAGTKLLAPMLVMLLIVLMIVMVPAFISFSRGGI